MLSQLESLGFAEGLANGLNSNLQTGIEGSMADLDNRK